MSEKSPMSKTRWLGMALMAFGVLLLLWFAIHRQPPPPPPPPPASEESPSPSAPPAVSELPLAAPTVVYPTQTMFVTPERLRYQTGEMVLRVPRLGLTVPLGGEVPEALRVRMLDGSATKEEQGAYYGNAEGDKLLKLGPVL
ncbi:MAG: hypothetical protein RR320_01150, partial [Oscillospiraceae bacterium]